MYKNHTKLNWEEPRGGSRDSIAGSTSLNANSSSPASHMYAEACLPDSVAPSILSM